MADYIGLGPRRLVGAADTTQNNPGNWTIAFTPDILAVSTQIPYFEIYKMVVKGAAGSSFEVFVDLYQWDTSLLGQLNSWDPSQPLQMQQGQTLYFYYSDPTTDNSPPTATIWLRYDKSLSLYGVGNS